jgi:hypothetical protein
LALAGALVPVFGQPRKGLCKKRGKKRKEEP